MTLPTSTPASNFKALRDYVRILYFICLNGMFALGVASREFRHQHTYAPKKKTHEFNRRHRWRQCRREHPRPIWYMQKVWPLKQYAAIAKQWFFLFIFCWRPPLPSCSNFLYDRGNMQATALLLNDAIYLYMHPAYLYNLRQFNVRHSSPTQRPTEIIFTIGRVWTCGRVRPFR